MTALFVALITPATSVFMDWLLRRSGQYAISDNDLFGFLASPLGLAFLIFGLGIVLAAWLAEQAGLLLIVNRGTKTHRSITRLMLAHTGSLPALIRLAAIQGMVALAASLPFAVAIALVYHTLLGEWDFYYYLNVRPTDWWIALAITFGIVGLYLALLTLLFARWLLCLPMVVLESKSANRALRDSWRTTRGQTLRIALPFAALWLVVFALVVGNTWLIGLIAGLLIPESAPLKWLVPAVILVALLITGVDFVLIVAGKVMHVLLTSRFYTTATKRPWPPPAAGNDRVPSSTTAALVGAFALISVVFLVTGLILDVGRSSESDRTTEITAHRGSKVRAPENTLAGVRQAIEEGADFAEIDVQHNADGVVVLLHDADFMRVASLPRRLQDTTSAELGEIDVGSWFDAEFHDERVPTLQQVIDLARGQIRLNVELKYTWADPDLATHVGEIIRRNDFVADSVVSSLNYGALAEFSRAFPEIETGFIVFQSLGNLARTHTGFLSLSAGAVSPALVRDLHRRNRSVHVWTVNDRANTLAMLEMGVDNIITDESQRIRRVISEWRELSHGERVALMLRNLIPGRQIPEPGPI